MYKSSVVLTWTVSAAFLSRRDRVCFGGDLPLAFLLTFCCSPGFYSASRWYGLPRLSSSQLLPVWTGAKVSQDRSSFANRAKQEVPVKWALSSLSPLSFSNKQKKSTTHTDDFFLIPWTCPRCLQASWTHCLSPTCSWCFVCCRWPWADPPLRSEGIETPCSPSTEKKWCV